MATLRWVLLRHECPDDYRDGPHWDLMLERAGVDDERRLATWSLSELPFAGSHDDSRPVATVDAVELSDHRAAYLDYEGPLTEGRGEVHRVAGGTITWDEATEGFAVAHLSDREVTFLVTLERVEGPRWKLSASPHAC